MIRLVVSYSLLRNFDLPVGPSSIELINGDAVFMTPAYCVLCQHPCCAPWGRKLDRADGGSRTTRIVRQLVRVPSSTGSPQGGEKDTDDLDVRIDSKYVGCVLEVGLVEDEDNLDEVEEDGEDKVRDGDPEQRFQARCIGPCYEPDIDISSMRTSYEKNSLNTLFVTMLSWIPARLALRDPAWRRSRKSIEVYL